MLSGEDGQTHLEARFVDKTVWLTQAQIVDLFQSSKANVSEYIKHIFEDGELDSGATVRDFRTVRFEGGREVARVLSLIERDYLEYLLAAQPLPPWLAVIARCRWLARPTQLDSAWSPAQRYSTADLGMALLFRRPGWSIQ